MTTPTISHRTLAGTFLLGLACVVLWSNLAGATGEISALLPCPVLSLTDIPCPGCGITRATVAFVSGDFGAAWAFHPFAFLLVPLALIYWLSPALTRSLWGSLPALARNITTGGAILACLVLWLARTPAFIT